MEKKNSGKPLYQDSFAYAYSLLDFFFKKKRQSVTRPFKAVRTRPKVKFYIFFTAFFFFFPQSSGARELSVNNESFVEIPEMIVPIVQRREVAGFFSITLALHCADKTIAKRVEKFLPIIRDRFFWDLYILLGVIWSSDFRTDVKELKQRLKKRIDQIMGKNVVSEVLVLSFQKHERKNVNRN